MGTAILVENLAKRYGYVQALKGVTFRVPQATIFGLLGPNGAGKTTTIKVLTGLSAPDGGRIEVLGLDPRRNSMALHRRIGVVQQDPSYEPTLSVMENLTVYATLWGLAGRDRARRVAEVVEIFELGSFLNRKPPMLSVGQRRRLQVAREFLHDAEVLFLDEATIGLDPVMRRSTLELIKARAATQGTTVVLTSHNMEEVEYVCDSVAILKSGSVVVQDSISNLLTHRAGTTTITISFPSRDDLEIAQRSLAPWNPIVIRDDTLAVHASSGAVLDVFQALFSAGCGIQGLDVHASTLEDVYLELIKD